MKRRLAFAPQRCPGCGGETDRGSPTRARVRVVVFVDGRPKERDAMTCSLPCAETVQRRALATVDGERLATEVPPPAPVAIQVALPLPPARREATS